MDTIDPDYALAMILQAKYNKEESAKRKKKSKENAEIRFSKSSMPQPVTNSIVDPIWETTDPTPDIHALFLAFNQRFFWGSLSSVEVCWSTRLKSSAGLCSYQKKNGFCSVRLSAPLLKLRPRSDLVETLLHELIHAYLFVTHDNRDRDGHGPVFQSHMHRINKEAGTKITIYHSFHDEVKLYQQHWWRCNGPCQNRKPFYGFVKRSMNRAPGPYDNWWTEHQATCGGIFIKIKEPGGFSKNKKSISNQNVKKTPITGFFKPISVSPSVSRIETKNSGNKSNNVFGLKDFTNKQVATQSSTGNSKHSTGAIRKSIFPKTRTETSVKDKTKHGTTTKSNISGFGSGGMLANKGGSTLVITSKNQKNGQHGNTECEPIVPFSGSGYVLGTSSGNKKSNSKLFTSNILGKSKSSDLVYNKIKQQKLENDSEVAETIKTEDKCPICNIKITPNKIDSHLKSCIDLSEVFNDNDLRTEDNYPNCNNRVPENLKNGKSLSNVLSGDEICKCPVCNMNVSRNAMNSHFEDCAGLSNVFNDSSTIEINDDEEEINETNKVPCPCCDKRFEESEINKHLDECLNLLLISEME